MHLLKEGQKIRAWVDPPPIIRAMPERKRFFPLMPSLTWRRVEAEPRELLLERGLLRRWREVDWEGGGGGGGAWGGVRQVAVIY